MHPVTYYESLLFCIRDDLERLQPVSKSLLNTIVRSSKVLPLRPIHRVYFAYPIGYSIRIFLKPYADEFDHDPVPDYETGVDEEEPYYGDFRETFLRLQNTCIKFFNVRIRDSEFLRYWQAQETAFTVVSINAPVGKHTQDGDYKLLDTIMNFLRPRSTEPYTDESAWQISVKGRLYVELLYRDSFLNNLQTCFLSVWDDDFPPPSFLLDWPSYRSFMVWCGDGQVVGGIDRFIESFVRHGCANKLESVLVRWDDSVQQPSPALKQLSEPLKTDVALPENTLVERIPAVRRVSRCETKFFENTMQWKRLEVYKWSIQYDLYDGPRTTHVLKCLVKHL
ncbi:hypothetical protein AAVH_17278 [Aphelenchoides avenae]|nr:hypothetical protein AAVH_17278 [Aphelenchus avenae]